MHFLRCIFNLVNTFIWIKQLNAQSYQYVLFLVETFNFNRKYNLGIYYGYHFTLSCSISQYLKFPWVRDPWCVLVTVDITALSAHRFRVPCVVSASHQTRLVSFLTYRQATVYSGEGISQAHGIWPEKRGVRMDTNYHSEWLIGVWLGCLAFVVKSALW